VSKSEKLPPVIMLAVDGIKIPDDRQRQKAEADDSLIQSIDRLGLLNPIIVHSDYTLVAGERRLDAFKKMNAKLIPARVFEELPPIARFEAELQENMARKQLTWQEEVLAIGRYHELRLSGYKGWTQMGTADALGISKSHISTILTIYEERGDEDVMACPTQKGAFNLISARAERSKIAAQNRGLLSADASASLLLQIPKNATKEERTKALLQNIKTTDITAKTVDEIDKNIKAIQEGRAADALLHAQRRLEIASEVIVNADFIEWAEEYDGPKFDVLHLDFPWGKNYSGARTRRTGKTHIAPVYDDDPDIFFDLIAGFLALQDRLAFPAAHCICWFDHIYYQWTVDQFRAAGWDLVQPHPFIWSKGYQGIAADVNRRPRHVYEAALLFVRGDRKIAKLDKDVIDCPVDEKLHLNQKPFAMLKHLLGIFVDEHTAVFDPTCGSGSALAAAKLLGASRVLGVELDPDNADIAKFMLQRAIGGAEDKERADDAGKSA
jgi:ParB/RepB/Spo0J family partition protein